MATGQAEWDPIDLKAEHAAEEQRLRDAVVKCALDWRHLIHNPHGEPAVEDARGRLQRAVDALEAHLAQGEP